MKNWKFVLPLVAIAFASTLAHASAIVIGLSSNTTSLDPHYHNATPNANVAEHMFDTLIAKDDNMRLVPALALSWRLINANTWEIKLRPGVKFHDGSEFTSADVEFSLNRPGTIKNSPSSYTTYTKSLKKIIAVDKLTLHISTDGPQPLTPYDLSAVCIVSKKSAQNASTEDFNNGKALIGTGPFKFAEFRRGERIELVRNDAYWGKKPQWDAVTLRFMTNDAARVAALLAGDVQVIENIPTSDIRKLSMNPAFSVFKTGTFRLMYIHLDTGRKKTPHVFSMAGNPLEHNPLQDLRVRQAISKAINRQAIVEHVMEGAAEATAQLTRKDTFGYAPDIQPDPLDIDGARKLLAAAGYPNGFAMTVHATSDRYVNDRQVVQAIASMLTRIGIQATVEAMPSSTFFTRANKLEFSFLLAGWSSDLGVVDYSVKALLATYNPETGWGTVNRGRYSNPLLDAKLLEAFSTLDNEKREILLRDATRIGMNDHGVIPLYFQAGVWAAKKGIKLSPRADERTHAYEVTADATSAP